MIKFFIESSYCLVNKLLILSKNNQKLKLNFMESNPQSLFLPLTPKSVPNMSMDKTFRQHHSSQSKKRIGQYHFYQKQFLGSGYSSRVYKCYKNNNKQKAYAIKVVNLNNLSRMEYSLLNNQVQILKQLNHPNIIKLYDVHYTKNNAYIITDFCESGTLENYIRKSNQNFDGWKNILHQILEAFKYLTDKLIIHRDIKPANIFLKEGIWKIGDFGFAARLSHKEQKIQQNFNVGSPLYMPPETLTKNIYSLKTDSFALGITLFYLLTFQFPWPNINSNKELATAYSQKQFPINKLGLIQEPYKSFVVSLCEINLQKRIFIDEFATYSLSLNPEDLISEEESIFNKFSILLQLSIVEKIKLCKFLFYLNKNIQPYIEMREICNSVKKVLNFICLILESQKNLKNYLDDFYSEDSKGQIREDQTKIFVENIEKKLKQLSWRKISIYDIIAHKLRQFMNILICILECRQTQLKELINEIVLQPNFSMAKKY